MADFWSEHIVFAKVLGRYEVASLEIEVQADSKKALPKAFTVTFTVRGLGAQIGRLASLPLQDGPIGIQLQPTPGTNFGELKGDIAHWRGLDSAGKVIDATADPDWKKAAAVAFSLDPVADVSIPVAAIVALVPHLGWLLGIIVAIFGTTIKVSLTSKPISMPVRRDSNGNLIPDV